VLSSGRVGSIAKLAPGDNQFKLEITVVGRCRLTVSRPVMKAPMFSALETRTSKVLSTFAFNFKLRCYTLAVSQPLPLKLKNFKVGCCNLEPVLKLESACLRRFETIKYDKLPTSFACNLNLRISNLTPHMLTNLRVCPLETAEGVG